MTNAEVIQRLRNCSDSMADLARAAKVNAKNLRNLRSGAVNNPRPEMLDALRDYFQRRKGRPQ